MALSTQDLYRNVLGREASPEEINSWGFGEEVDDGELDRFLGAARNEVVETRPTSGAVGKIAQQILDQGTTDKWGGEGFGSAQKNAYDMAAMLAGQGITDIRDFGVRTTENNEQQYYNKTTGQPIQAFYDKAGGDVWGGTFAGEGSTSYGVQFTQDGLPVFYTKYGGSSNSLVNLIGDNKLLNIAASVAAAYFGGPAGVAALQTAMGKDIGDIAKSAALTYVGGQIASGVSGAESVIDTLGQTGANIAGRVAGAVATGQDPIAALATAGLGQTVGEGLGLSGTTASTVGSSLIGGVTAELRGKDATMGAISGAVSGYLSGEKNIRDAKTAVDADIAGGMVPEYGTNESYDSFMQSAMTPEAQLAIEQSIAEQPTVSSGYDATEFEGSLAKEPDQTKSALGEVFKPMSGTDALKTGVKAALAGGAVAAGGAAINSLVNRPTVSTSTTTDINGVDIYKDAPIKGYHMRQDSVTGKYIPYIGDRALLAKGGFVTKRN